MADKYAYLGVGLAVPSSIKAGAAVLASGKALIEGSIINICTTKKGTRFYNRDFGCDAEDYLFEPNDEIAIRLIKYSVLSALRKWEPRARFDDNSEILIGLDVVLINVNYYILSTNEPGSIVIPFFKGQIPY